MATPIVLAPRPAIQFSPAGIPEEMRVFDQWQPMTLGYESEADRDNPKKKARKFPCFVQRGVAYMAKWRGMPFEGAMAVMEAHPDLVYGLGFHLSEEDPFVVVDFDTMRGEDDPRRKYLNSGRFVELSQSGTGYHLVVEGELEAAYTLKGVEIYSTKRLIFMTGNLAEGAGMDIVDGQDLIDELRREFPRKEKSRGRGVVAVERDDMFEFMQAEGLITGGGPVWYSFDCPKCGEHSDGDKKAYISPKGCGDDPEHQLITGINCFHTHELTYREMVEHLRPMGFEAGEDTVSARDLPRIEVPFGHYNADERLPTWIIERFLDVDDIKWTSDSNEIWRFDGVIDTDTAIKKLMHMVGREARMDEISKRLVTRGFEGKISEKSINKDEDAAILMKVFMRRNAIRDVDVDRIMYMLARGNPINTTRDWLADQKPVEGAIGKMCALMEFEDESKRPLVELQIRKWLIQACAAADGAESTPLRAAGIARPSFSYVLMFFSQQGTNKTKFIAKLTDANEEVVQSVSNVDMGNEDTALRFATSWIIDFGEVSATFRKSDKEATKQMLSQEKDVYRFRYERKHSSIPRHCCGCGTTNDRSYLRDQTGNRRFWTVPVISIDVDAMTPELVGHVWGEAWQAYMSGEKWWLDDEQEQQAEEHRRRFERSTHEEIAIIETFGTDFSEESVDFNRRWNERDIAVLSGIVAPDEKLSHTQKDNINACLGRLNKHRPINKARYNWYHMPRVDEADRLVHKQHLSTWNGIKG